MRMKLGNLLVLAFVAILAWFGIAAAGFGIAFEFSDRVLVPWLGFVQPQYHNLAALIGALAFTGVGSIVVVVVFALTGLAALALFRLFFRRSS